MKITEEQFIEEVKKELATIKEKATKEEIGKLDFGGFNERMRDECIYGQMTGDCGSERAKEIMPKVLHTFSSIRNFRAGTDFTWLEFYLFECGGEIHQRIFNYLQGKTDTIELGL